MNAEQILKAIIEDGFLSETNMHRGRSFFNLLEGEIVDVLESCRVQAKTGDKVAAIKRYRVAAGCGLQAAYDAVCRY